MNMHPNSDHYTERPPEASTEDLKGAIETTLRKYANIDWSTEGFGEVIQVSIPVHYSTVRARNDKGRMIAASKVKNGGDVWTVVGRSTNMSESMVMIYTQHQGRFRVLVLSERVLNQYRKLSEVRDSIHDASHTSVASVLETTEEEPM